MRFVLPVALLVVSPGLSLAQIAKERAVYKGHKSPVTAIAFSPDGKTLASVEAEKVIKVWDIAKGQEKAILDPGERIVHTLAYSDDGKILVSASDSRRVKIWNALESKEKATFSWPERGEVLQKAALGPKARFLALGSSSGKIALWDVEKNKPERTIQAHQGMVTSLAFSQDGKHLASNGGGEENIKLWDAASGKEIGLLKGELPGVMSLAFTPNGKILAADALRPKAGRIESVVNLWDVAGKKVTGTLTGHTSQVRHMGVTADSKILATGALDRSVKLWDIATPKEITTIQCPANVSAMDITRDGTLLAIGMGPVIKVYDLKLPKN